MIVTKFDIVIAAMSTQQLWILWPLSLRQYGGEKREAQNAEVQMFHFSKWWLRVMYVENTVF